MLLEIWSVSETLKILVIIKKVCLFVSLTIGCIWRLATGQFTLHWQMPTNIDNQIIVHHFSVFNLSVLSVKSAKTSSQKTGVTHRSDKTWWSVCSSLPVRCELTIRIKKVSDIEFIKSKLHFFIYEYPIITFLQRNKHCSQYFLDSQKL